MTPLTTTISYLFIYFLQIMTPRIKSLAYAAAVITKDFATFANNQ